MKNFTSINIVLQYLYSMLTLIWGNEVNIQDLCSWIKCSLIFRFLRNPRTGFQSGWINLHFHQHCCYLFLLLFRSFLIWWRPICQFLLLYLEPLKSYSGICSLCLCLTVYSPIFSFRSFQVSGLILRSMIHFGLINLQSKR